MVTAREGDANATITCTANSVPVPTINWNRSDNGSLTGSRYVISGHSIPTAVTNGSNEVFQITSSLTILNVVRGDTGVYSCVASNVVNNVQSDISVSVLCKLLSGDVLLAFVILKIF